MGSSSVNGCLKAGTVFVNRCLARCRLLGIVGCQRGKSTVHWVIGLHSVLASVARGCWLLGREEHRTCHLPMRGRIVGAGRHSVQVVEEGQRVQGSSHSIVSTQHRQRHQCGCAGNMHCFECGISVDRIEFRVTVVCE
jgi:hypothetical protein